MEKVNKQIEAIKVALELLKYTGEITQAGVDSVLLGLNGLNDLVKNLTIPVVNGSAAIKTLTGYVAMNKNEYNLENMTFLNTRKRALDYWLDQQIVKVTVKFHL